MSEQIYTALLPVAGLAAGTVITYIFGKRKISQRDDHIEELKGTVKTRDKKIKSLNKSLKEHETRVNEMLKLKQEREQEITSLKAKERAMQDDFSYLDGVGPKISSILRSAGIKTFAKLATKEVDDLREILVAENPSLLRLSDPTTWPDQAGMAAEGRWENLKALQEILKERRRRERQRRPADQTQEQFSARVTA